MGEQAELFGGGRALPEGFRYEPDVIGPEEEAALLERVRALAFRRFEFHGYVGKRRVISYGWHYDFAERALQAAEPIPDFLLPLREVSARFAGIAVGAHRPRPGHGVRRGRRHWLARAPSGSTVSPPWIPCATPSPSAI